jgi:hypothetical protein
MSAYNEFMNLEIVRLEAANPGIDRKTAFKQAAANWKIRERSASLSQPTYPPPIPPEIERRVDDHVASRENPDRNSILKAYLQTVGPGVVDYYTLSSIMERQSMSVIAEDVTLALIEPGFDQGPRGMIYTALVGDSHTLLSAIQQRPSILLSDYSENPLSYAVASGRWELVASILRLPLPISYDGLEAAAQRVVEVQRIHPLTSNDVTALLQGLFGRMEQLIPDKVYTSAAQVYISGNNGPNGFYDQILPFFFGLDQQRFQAALTTEADTEFFVMYQRQYAEMQLRASNVNQGVNLRRSRSPSLSSPPRNYSRVGL